MNWGKIYGEKRRGEKCLAGKIVFWGKMLQSRSNIMEHIGGDRAQQNVVLTFECKKLYVQVFM